MLLAALILAGNFVFPGGTIDDLVASLATRFSKSIVAGVYEPDTIPAFRCADDLPSVAKQLHKVAPFSLVDCRSCLAVEPTRLPAYIANIKDLPGYARKRTPAPRAPSRSQMASSMAKLDGAKCFAASLSSA